MKKVMLRADAAGFPGFPNPKTIPQELVDKYKTRGPRYTSYPTAPHFHDQIEQTQIAARWEQGNRSRPPRGLSIYFHIPFCRERCWFCACHVVIRKNSEVAAPYVGALRKEMDSVHRLVDPDRPVRQIAFGGGTPTFLPPEQLGELIDSVNRAWSIDDDAEISIEVDPRTVTHEQLDLLLARGFNRFSLGVQDFDGDVLELVHRPQSREVTEEVVNHLKGKGIEAINFDLIYGLPGQNMENSAQTLQTTIDLRPSRIAFYNYAHVPWLKPHQKIVERHGLPDAELKLRIFGQAYSMLSEAGYLSIGMDHFALPEDELATSLLERTLHRNFMGYTTRRGLDLLAFGVSAISSAAATYVQNRKEVPAYYAALEEGRFPWERGFLLSEEDLIRRELIIDLFCNFHLDTKAFERRWKIDFLEYFPSELNALRDFERDDLVEINENEISVTPIGRFFIRNVCMTFDRYLERDTQERKYSQTL